MATPLPCARAAAALLFCLAALPAAAGPLEDDVLAELNYARADPVRYGRELAREAGDGAYGLLRDEDPRVVDEAIDFLMSQPPLPPLADHPGLSAAAAAHVRAQSRRGAEGHGGGTGGLSARLAGQRVFAGLSAEAISYGYSTPREVVAQLLVDSRVTGRGHRKTLLGRSWQAAGVACGPHAAYGAMCVIDFAGAIQPSPGARAD